MPAGRPMETVDERWVRAGVRTIFDIVRDVEHWPAHLGHYRFVRFRERTRDGGGVVEMSANRPFGLFNWPTWWLSEMAVDHERPAVRFRHIGGVTKGMDEEWAFESKDGGTQVTLLHVWDGPPGAPRRELRGHPGDRPGVRARHREPDARGAGARGRGSRAPGGHMTHRRVVVTGIGALTPIGLTAPGMWAGLRAQRSAVGTLFAERVMPAFAA